MIVNISTMDESFPTDASINAFYDGAKTRLKNGEVDEVKWLEIDGLKGLQFREANPEKPDGIRRLQWMGYRKYAGQVVGKPIRQAAAKDSPSIKMQCTAFFIP